MLGIFLFQLETMLLLFFYTKYENRINIISNVTRDRY